MWKRRSREAERLVQGHQLVRGSVGLNDSQVHVLYHLGTLPLGSGQVTLCMNKQMHCAVPVLLKEVSFDVSEKICSEWLL